jgi:hypothetical protein
MLPSFLAKMGYRLIFPLLFSRDRYHPFYLHPFSQGKTPPSFLAKMGYQLIFPLLFSRDRYHPFYLHPFSQGKTPPNLVIFALVHPSNIFKFACVYMKTYWNASIDFTFYFILIIYITPIPFYLSSTSLKVN